MSVIRIERKQRGCGIRKKGGLYLFFDMQNIKTCPNLPMELPERCPVCGEELEQFRGIKVVNPKKYLKPVEHKCSEHCPVCNPPDSGAIMWVGKKFYSIQSFIDEALTMGISKRIAKIPSGMKPNDVMYFLHPEAISRFNLHLLPESSELMGFPQTIIKEKIAPTPGIFLAARLSAIHRIIDKKQAEDTALIKDLEEKGTTPVVEYDPVAGTS